MRIAGEEFVALVDTGFDGYVMLSQADINRLNLREMGKTTYRTADGQIHEGRVYHGRIERSLRLVMEPARQLLTLSADPLH